MTEILFADDDAGMRQMVADVLRSQGHGVRLAAGGREALAELRESLPDLVILDYRMGPPDGFAVCREIKSSPRLHHLPVLILTAGAATEEKLAGFDAGADDYLAKPFDSRELLARVQALLRLSRSGLDRNPTSALPGGEAIEREYERRRSAIAPFALCYFDLDHFKPFGDRFGFAAGDAVIREAAAVLVDVSGPDDFVGHVGGDDFILICGADRAKEMVATARGEFQERLRAHVPAEVWNRGSFFGKDREDREREIPLTRMAAALLYVNRPQAPPLAELGATIAELKLAAKRSPGGLAERSLDDVYSPEADRSPEPPAGGSSSRNS